MTEFYRVTQRKARKVHPCEGCGKAIEIGELYKRTATVFEGEFYDLAEHVECHDLNVEMYRDSDADPYEWTGLWEEIHNGDYPDDNAFKIRFDKIRESKRTMAEAKAAS